MAGIQGISFTNPYSDQEMEIARRQQLAQHLQQQASQPVDQQTAGGWVIPYSPMQGLNKVAQGALAGYLYGDTQQRQKSLTQQAQTDALKWYMDQPQARAASAPGFPGEPEQLTGGTVQPSKQEQMAWLMRGQMNPFSSPMAGAMLAQAMKTPNDMLGKIDPKDYSSESFQQFMTSGNPAVLRPKQDYVTVGNNLVPKPQGGPTPVGGIQPVYTAPEKDEAAKFNAILKGAGIDPASPQGQALFKALATKTATHQPGTVVNVSTEKKYGEQLAGQIAQADSAMRDSAIKAPDLADRSNNIRKILASGNTITGTGAEFRLQFAKAAQLAGLGDGSAAATEQVATSLAQNTLDAIKASGLGSGSGFSNADRDFLEKAVGGKITLERETLERLAALSHRAAAKSAEKWNTRVKEIPATALQGTGIKTDPIEVPALFATPAGDTPLSREEQAELDRLRGQYRRGRR